MLWAWIWGCNTSPSYQNDNAVIYPQLLKKSQRKLKKAGASHFCSPPLEIGVRSQEPGARRKEEEGRSQNKCFYKDEMLPRKLRDG